MLPPPLLSIAPEQSRELPKGVFAVCLILVTHRDRQRTPARDTQSRVDWLFQRVSVTLELTLVCH